MAIISTISGAITASARRFDSDYFRPEYLTLLSQLSKHSTESITSLCHVTDGNHASISKYFSSGASVGPRYLRGQDIGDFLLGDSNPVYIPKRIYDSLKRSHMQPGDVLLSIVGTIGSLSLVPSEAAPLTGSCKIAVLRPRRDRISPEYLAAFLTSRYGQFQIRRQTRGAVQMGIILEDMRFIRVVRLGEAEQIVTKDVQLAYQHVCKAKTLYNSAQRILEEEIGLEKANPLNRLGYGSRLSEIFHARRWDAYCFNPVFLRYGEVVQSHGNFARLGQLIFPPVKGIQQENVEKGNVAYASIKHVRDFEMVTEARVLSSVAASKVAEPGDLLLAITGATIGKVGIVTRYKQLAFSGDLLRLRVQEGLDPHYLLVVLRSPIGQGQLLRWVTGSTNGHLAPRDVMRVLIPRLGKKEQIISAKVQEALSARKEAEDLLAQAKRRVEEMIEQARKVR